MSLNQETVLQKTQAQIWQDWARSIRNNKLNEIVAVLLESGGPFNILTAQMLHIAKPVLNAFTHESSMPALTNLLEEPENTRSFIQLLREDSK